MSRITNPFSAFRRLAPIDIIVLVFLVFLLVAGVFIIYKSRTTVNPVSEAPSIPVFAEVGDRPVEAVNNSEAVTTDNPQAIKDELLVTISDKAHLAQFGDNIESIDDLPNTYRLKVEGQDTLSQKQVEVAAKPGVESVNPNYVVFATEPPQPTPNKKPVARFDRWQWGIDKIGARSAWGITKGSGVTVAVLDTGVRGDHVEIRKSLDGPHKTLFPAGQKSAWGNGGWACVNDGNPLHDFDGHGTAVASIITAAGDRVGMAGVSPDAKIMAVQVLSCAGAGTAESIARGIRHAVDNGADVINMSLGSYGGKGCANVEVDAINYAISKNVLVVASSGNERHGSVGCPARLPGIMAIGAINRDGSIVANVSWGSNWGSQQSVMAPGIHIAAADNASSPEWWEGKKKVHDKVFSYSDRYVLKFNGTSAAAPHVAGVAALVRSINPQLTPAQVKDIIQKTTTNPGSQAGKLPNSTYGHGIVNAYNAVTYTKQYHSPGGGR